MLEMERDNFTGLGAILSEEDASGHGAERFGRGFCGGEQALHFAGAPGLPIRWRRSRGARM